FRGKPVPPYAILSHRWSDSEALIEDISNARYKEKEEGYQKLKFCAEQAAKDGLQYFWVDTCCIDRWDNNERSKAINTSVVSIYLMKELMYRDTGSPEGQHLLDSRVIYGLLGSPDNLEGFESFLEKRQPKFL
ncbi:hypothetical protein E8E12_000044, partial [Didymella heteroderae]